MNGYLTPELIAYRLGELERTALATRRASKSPERRLRRSLGHVLVILGSRLEGAPAIAVRLP
jgi:hypothetical protein